MPNPLTNKELNEKIFRQALKKVGMSQKDLAKAVDVKEKTFSAYLKTGNFDEAKSKEIADRLNLTTKELWIPVQPGLSKESIDFENEYYSALRRENVLLRSQRLNSDSLSTEMEAVRGLLKEIYVELVKQREISEEMLKAGRGRSKA